MDSSYTYRSKKYNIFKSANLKNIIRPNFNVNKITPIGCLIQIIKSSHFVIGDLKGDVGKLALLLKKPLIYPNRKLSDDSVHLLNPLNTPIFDCENIEEGIKFYENNI